MDVTGIRSLVPGELARPRAQRAPNVRQADLGSSNFNRPAHDDRRHPGSHLSEPLMALHSEIVPASLGVQQLPFGNHTMRKQVYETARGETLYIGGRIGKGHHGEVRVVALYENGHRHFFALKSQAPRPERHGATRAYEVLERRVLNEVALLRQARSSLAPLSLLRVERPEPLLMMLGPLMEGTLDELRQRCVSETSRSILADAVFVQLAPALRELHESLGVFNQDIKPENILVDRRGTLLFADFGLGTRSRQSERGAGTADFMAPEVLAHSLSPYTAEGFELTRNAGPYDTARAEIWQLGTSILEVLAGKGPFYSSRLAHVDRYTNVDYMQRFVERHGEAWQQWPTLRRLDIVRRPGHPAHPLEHWLAESLAVVPYGSQALDAAFRMVRYAPESRSLPLPGDDVASLRVANQLREHVRNLVLGLDNEVQRARAQLAAEPMPQQLALPRIAQLDVEPARSTDDSDDPFSDGHAVQARSSSNLVSLHDVFFASEMASSEERLFWRPEENAGVWNRRG